MIAAIKFLVAIMCVLIVFGATLFAIDIKKDSTAIKDVLYWVFIILTYVTVTNLVLIFIKYIIY